VAFFSQAASYLSVGGKGPAGEGGSSLRLETWWWSYEESEERVAGKAAGDERVFITGRGGRHTRAVKAVTWPLDRTP